MNCFGPPPRKRKSSSKKSKSKKSSANMMPDPIDMLLNEEFERAKATRRFAYFRSFMGNPSDQPAFSSQSNWWEPSHSPRQSEWAAHHDTLNQAFAKTNENGSNLQSLRTTVDEMCESHGGHAKQNGEEHARIIKAQEFHQAQMKKHGDSLDQILRISQGLDEDVKRRRELEEQQRMKDALKGSFEQGKQAQLDADNKRWELEEQKRLQEALFESYEKRKKAQLEVQEQYTKTPPPVAVSGKNIEPLPRVEALSEHILGKMYQREEDERLESTHRQWHARLEEDRDRTNRREREEAARFARLMEEESRLRARMGAIHEDTLRQERMFPAPRYRVDYEDESLELGAPWGNDMADRRPPQRYRDGGGRRTHPRYSSEFGYFP
ncbi:hypothetical protein PG994_010539 [Apiospora phragmitis]|uniref:Uncharacterized protein n=1 Tax=Apiospora phragmitis TaxID=2905665 RepID=A0ABR1TQ86_9PEZI